MSAESEIPAALFPGRSDVDRIKIYSGACFRTTTAAACIQPYMRITMLMMAMLAIWPLPSGKDYRMTADQSVPAAAGTVHVQHDKDNGNTKLDIKVSHLARPANLNPPATTYLVWIRPSDGEAVKQGALKVDHDLNGELHTVSVSKNFDLFITPEDGETVMTPSSKEVLRTHITME